MGGAEDVNKKRVGFQAFFICIFVVKVQLEWIIKVVMISCLFVFSVSVSYDFFFVEC